MNKKKNSMFSIFSLGFVILFFVVAAVPQGLLAQDPTHVPVKPRLRLSFHVGATYPLGIGSIPEENPEFFPYDNLNDYADSNVHVRFNLDYQLFDNIDFVLFLGFSQFTDDYTAGVHYYTFNLSGNFKWFFPVPSGLEWYLQAGPGFYMPKPNLTAPYPTSNTLGFNVGIGARIPLSSNAFDLEWGVDVHNINFSKSEEPKYWFLTFQLGVIFK